MSDVTEPKKTPKRKPTTTTTNAQDEATLTILDSIATTNRGIRTLESSLDDLWVLVVTFFTILFLYLIAKR